MKIREPAVQGTFYPLERQVLYKMVENFINNSPVKFENGKIYGILCPHAGYVFSGSTAGVSYASLKGKNYKRAVILAPTHYHPFKGIALSEVDAWLTPLSKLFIDKDFNNLVLKNIKFAVANESYHSLEHSVEVQLPFLKYLFNDIKIVPIVIGEVIWENIDEFAHFLSENLDENDLLVSSSDLYHGYSVEECDLKSEATLAGFEKDNAKDFYYSFKQGIYEACGYVPMAILVRYAEYKSLNRRVLWYTNSHRERSEENFGYVVGYGSAIVYKEAN